VWGSGYTARGFGFGLKKCRQRGDGLGIRGWGLGVRGQELGFKVNGSGFRG